MIEKYKNNQRLRHIFWITVIYFAAHWFLIVVSGRWWDDWVYYDHDVEYMKEVFRQSSLPLQAYINMSVWSLPYRHIVFIFFYLGSILLYGLLCKIDLFSKDACFWISALYTIIPVNDARITFVCYGYSLGLFSFWIAFYIVSIWRSKTGKSKVFLRILSLLILLFSFNTESIMLMTVLILIYLYYTDIIEEKVNFKDIKGFLKRILVIVIKYVDFLIAPVVFYFGKNILFPGYGVYGGHNYVPWDLLLQIVTNALYYAYITFSRILENYFVLFKNTIVLYLLVVVLIIYIFFVKRSGRALGNLPESSELYKKNILMLLLGALFFFIGFFPYVMVRDRALLTTYINGRDTLLLGLGTAILIYYLMCFALNKNFCKIFFVTIIVLGICHFNIKYIDWQENYYQQLQFEQEVRQNENIQNGTTFLCLYENPALDSSFYQLNGNAFVATGEQTRFFLCGIKNLARMIELDENSWCLNAYNMKEYDPTDKVLEGVIFINNEPISTGTILKQKWNEIFHRDIFYEWINEIKDIEYVPISKEQSDAIVEAFQHGILNENNICEYIDY